MDVKLRHRVFMRLLYIIAGPFVKLLLRYRCKKPKSVPAPALIVSNHTTNLDPALVALGLPLRHTVFVASEHTARWGLPSRILWFVFGPITRVKGKTDAKSGKQILRTLRGGYSVCLFAEGNRSFSGLTGPIFPATGKLAKAAGTALITYRITGGYFAAPRWSKKMRTGPINGEVVRIYSSQELGGMSADEVNRAIQADLSEDAYARQEQRPRPYRGGGLAEYIETALYLCPSCGAIGSISSKGNSFVCRCGLCGVYDKYGKLSGAERPGVPLRFASVRDWNLWQEREMPCLVAAAGDAPICADEGEELYRLLAGGKSTLVATGTLTLYRGRLCCAEYTFDIGGIGALAIAGRQTILFSTAAGEYYELKNPAPRSALKYQRACEILRQKTGEER